MKRVILCLCCLCMSVPLLAAPAVAMHWAEAVDTTANLYRVDDKLYRSQQPLAANRAELEALGIRTVGEFPNLTETLLKRGHSERVVRKIMGENWVNVLKDVWGE